MKTVEQAAEEFFANSANIYDRYRKEYRYDLRFLDGVETGIEDAFIAGAKWQEEQTKMSNNNEVLTT